MFSVMKKYISVSTGMVMASIVSTITMSYIIDDMYKLHIKNLKEDYENQINIIDDTYKLHIKYLKEDHEKEIQNLKMKNSI
jgi:hypothetical protein